MRPTLAIQTAGLALAALLTGLCPQAAPADSDTKERVQVTRARIHGQKETPVYGYRVAKDYPHRSDAYTEGLVMSGGALYEGTGLYTRSRLMKQRLETGALVRQHPLDARYFGEGVTVLGDEVYQLTYLSNVAFVYDRDTLTPKRRLSYPTQGWGLTQDGKELIMSNGSSALLFLDPVTFAIERDVLVADEVGPVGFLNELEYVDGAVYANVWQSDFIARIDPRSGKVTAWIDLTGLNPDPQRLKYPYVLNGIAYNRETGRLLVTGKCWPKVYEIDLVRPQGHQPSGRRQPADSAPSP
jgi:glutamine cyclotransferase